MRVRDDEKREALIQATVKLVNQIGFASSSVSKIAKEAGVSPSTLYIYFKNKEDLLVSAYVDIKRDLRDAMLNGFDDSLPVRDVLQFVWFRTFEYVSKHGASFAYVEQFSNSPYSALVDRAEIEQLFAPVLGVLQRGIEQKILKDVNFGLIAAFMFPPIAALANPTLCHGEPLTGDDITQAFTMAWDAMKL